MREANVNVSEFMGGGGASPKRHLDGCNFRFYPHYKLNKERTEKVGYAQHDPKEFIEIIIFNGERTAREVEDRDIRAYPEEYKRFKEREEKPVSGMYLREWSMITPAMLADLEAYGLKTVEQLADVSEDVINKLPFLKEPNEIANMWLESAKSKQAEITNLKKKLKKTEENYRKLEDQFNTALQRIEANEGIRFSA